VIVAGPVVEAVAVTPVMGRAEYALDRANGTANAGANRPSDHPAYRTRNPVAFIGALLGAADDALAMAGVWNAKQRQRKDACSEYERS
jgi:hypothetical protein